MPAAFLAPNAQFRSWDNSGAPLVGGKLFTYSAGTSTPVATYTDSTGGTPNTNPIILNSRGEAQVWLTPNVGYKFVLQDRFGNPIWTVDQLFNSQLLTLFGGTDTGFANSYVLNFVSNFTSLVNGIVVYWIPANTNTGPSTLNVNGLGPIPILNQGGAPLTAGQLFANQVANVMYFNGNWLLISSGYSSAAAQSLFIANRSIGAGNQTFPPNAITIALFDAVTANQNSVYNTGTGLFTAPTTGIYQFTCIVAMESPASSFLAPSIFFSKNGLFSVGQFWPTVGQFLGAPAGGAAVPANTSGAFGATAQFVMNAGDTMQISVQTANPGGGFFMFGDGKSSQFSGYRVG
jgi:hypothetical protein